MLNNKWLGTDTLRKMSEKYNALIDLLNEATGTKFALKTTKIKPGSGLQGGGTLEEDRTLSIKLKGNGLTSTDEGLALNLVADRNSESETQAVTAKVVTEISRDLLSITPVDTINDLIASTKYAVGDVVEVLGYYEKGDGAGHQRQKKPIGYNGADAVIGTDGSIWGIVHNGKVNVSWFGAKGDGVTDDTSFIQNAINFSENIKINKGKFLISRLNFPYSFANKSFTGSGYGIWREDNSTIFVAKESVETMFYYADGANFIETSNFNIDCKNLANIGLGSYYELKENGHYGGYECFGGGKNIHRVYVKDAKYTGIMLGALSTADKIRVTGCDIEVQSDSTLNDIEVSGGRYGILVSAGGNFLNNIWSNTNTESCITIKPLNVGTNCQNIMLNNVYVGEVINSETKNIIDIKEFGTMKVWDVNINNAYIVCADSTAPKRNYGIGLSEVLGCNLNNINIRGDKQTDRQLVGFMNIKSGKDIKISNARMNGCTASGIVFSGGDTIQSSISNVTFEDFSKEGSLNYPCVDVQNNSHIMIDSCYITSSDKGYFLRATNFTNIRFENIVVNYPNTLITSSNIDADGTYKRIGDKTFTTLSKNIVAGTFVFTGGGTENTILSLPLNDYKTEWKITISQSGTGINNTIGYVSCFQSSFGVATVGNSNDAEVLKNKFKIVDGTLKVVSGTGYGGAGNWDYTLKRI